MDGHVVSTIIYERSGQKIKENLEHLGHFLRDLDEMVACNGKGLDTRLDVFEAVKEMVQKILDVVGVLDPTMAAGKINPVGSFKENTKLGVPNEFDFVAEMKVFDKMKTLAVQDECKVTGAVHLVLSEAGLQTTMEHLVTENEGQDDIIRYLSPVKFRNRFWQLVTAVATHFSANNVSIVNKAGKLNLVKDIPQVLDMYHKGPNIEVFMVWTSADEKHKFGMSVDVTPALCLFDTIPETVGVDSERLQRYLQTAGNSISDVLLIPTINLECRRGGMADCDEKLCWKLSFSLLETQIIQNMNPEHKQCLRIMKHLKSNQKDGVQQMSELGLNLDPDPFSSTIISLQHSHGEMSLLTTYRIKMVILEHDEICKNQSRSSAKCLLEIMDLIKQRVREKFLPIFFIPAKNAWPRGPLCLLEKSVDKIIQLFHHIMIETHYSFEKNFEKFVEVQTYVTERDGI